MCSLLQVTVRQIECWGEGWGGGGGGLELLITIFIILPLRVCFVSKSQKRSSKKTYRDLQYLCVRFSTVYRTVRTVNMKMFRGFAPFPFVSISFLLIVYFILLSCLYSFLRLCSPTLTHSLFYLSFFLSPLSPPPLFSSHFWSLFLYYVQAFLLHS